MDYNRILFGVSNSYKFGHRLLKDPAMRLFCPYNLPGRWQTGTEDLLVRRVQEIRQGSDCERLPLSPDEALKQIAVSAEFIIEQVASEPLIQDPVNFAFDSRGRLWVVEMRDYPLGVENGGCIKILTDSDRDGRMDSATVFLDNLSYPNRVFPYRDGAIVACAPDVFFAADRDGDGLAGLGPESVIVERFVRSQFDDRHLGPQSCGRWQVQAVHSSDGR